MKLFVESKRG